MNVDVVVVLLPTATSKEFGEGFWSTFISLWKWDLIQPRVAMYILHAKIYYFILEAWSMVLYKKRKSIARTKYCQGRASADYGVWCLAGVFDTDFFMKRWTMNFFDTGQKSPAGDDGNQNINFHWANAIALSLTNTTRWVWLPLPNKGAIIRDWYFTKIDWLDRRDQAGRRPNSSILINPGNLRRDDNPL
jgi:hypothetical protein